jgi:transaldolase
MLKKIVGEITARDNFEILWASTREIYNLFQAIDSGCQIITITAPLLRKLANIGKGLDQLSLETVAMFYEDARSSGYSI